MIYHVTTKQQWKTALENNVYLHDSLVKENFIHACSREQLSGVLNRYYKDVPDLLLLHIEENKLSSTLKYEHSPSINDSFAHVYGPINIDAVVETESL